MTPLEFLTAVWPDEGLYCIGTPYPGKTALNHRVFSTIKDAATFVEKVKNNENVYYATHALKEERAWDKKNEKFRVRTQLNMRAGKEFFFEVDCDHGLIGYSSQEEALVATLDFCRAARLPLPLVVSSGGGLHLHWILDRALSSNTEWLTIAARLKQLAKLSGFKVDPSRTTDTSSVLRVAGTFNLKKDTRRDVAALTPFKVVDPDLFSDRITRALEIAGETPIAPRDEMDIGNNMSIDMSQLIPPPMELVYEVCPQMRRLRDIDRAKMSEPEWHAAAGIHAFVENGAKLFHEFSKGHPNYDFDGCQGKLERWRHGPTSCAKIADASGPHLSICNACTYAPRGQGPVTFARNIRRAPPPVLLQLVDGVEVATVLTDPPENYFRSPEKGVEALAEGKNGQQFRVDVYPYDFYPIERTYNAVLETEHQFWRVHTPQDGIREFSLDAPVLTDDARLKERLANVGVHAEHYIAVRDYMSAYVRHLQSLVKMKAQYNHLGWIDDYTRFVVPGKTYEPDGSITHTTLGVIANEASVYIAQKGNLEEQVRLMNFINIPEFLPHQYFIGSSLASIMFHVTGTKYGMTINMAGDTGGMKSSAINMAAGFWGPPTHYVINGVKGKVTAKFVGTRMQLLQNLPFMLDEITLMPPDEARAAAFAATQPQTNPQGNTVQGTNRKDPIGGIHAAVSMSTSNVSLISVVSKDNTSGSAVAARILELWVPRQNVYKKAQVDQFLRALDQHYGHIGEAFARFYVANKAEVDALVVQCAAQLEAKIKLVTEDRFHIDHAAATLVALKVAHHLGLLPFDATAIRTWVVQTMIPEQRTKASDELSVVTPINLLTDYLELIEGSILKVEKGGANIPGGIRGPLLAHYDLDRQFMYVLKEGFRRHCAQRNQHSLPILRHLFEAGLVSDLNGRFMLGVGTEYAKGRSTCFKIDMRHPDIAGLAVAAPASNVVKFPNKGVNP